MPNRASKYPTELELMILKILWRNGPSTAREVRDLLADQRVLECTSVTVVMNIMMNKGYLTRDKKYGCYAYRPRISEKVTTRRIIGDVVDRVFDGSAIAAVLKLLETSDIDVEKLKDLRKLINRKVKEQS